MPPSHTNCQTLLDDLSNADHTIADLPPIPQSDLDHLEHEFQKLLRDRETPGQKIDRWLGERQTHSNTVPFIPTPAHITGKEIESLVDDFCNGLNFQRNATAHQNDCNHPRIGKETSCKSHGERGSQPIKRGKVEAQKAPAHIASPASRIPNPAPACAPELPNAKRQPPNAEKPPVAATSSCEETAEGPAAARTPDAPKAKRQTPNALSYERAFNAELQRWKEGYEYPA